MQRRTNSILPYIHFWYIVHNTAICLQLEWPTLPTTQGGRGIRLPKRIKNRTTGKPAAAGQAARHRAVQSRKYRAVAGAVFCIGRCGRYPVPTRCAEFPAGDNRLSPLFPYLGELWCSQCDCHSQMMRYRTDSLPLNAQNFSRQWLPKQKMMSVENFFLPAKMG